MRQVYEALLEERKIAYTTVMTMMKILEKKKYLKKDQGERAFVYEPVASERRVLSAMVAEFVNRVFNGAAKPLLVPSGGRPEVERQGCCRDSEVAQRGGRMSAELVLRNLIAFVLQTSVIAVLGVLLPWALRLRAPKPLLAYWQGLLGLILVTPFVPYWAAGAPAVRSPACRCFCSQFGRGQRPGDTSRVVGAGRFGGGTFAPACLARTWFVAAGAVSAALPTGVRPPD